MPYATRQGPWVGADSVGNDFSNFMLQLAAQKARQAALEEEHNYRQATLDQHQPLIMSQVLENQAQTKNFDAESKLNQEKSLALQTLGANSEDAGLAAFGQEMSQNPEYDPNKTSYLPNTPENRKMLTAAMLARSLTKSAASSPAASADLLKPIEANRGTTVLAPSGRVIGYGPKMPPQTKTLAPGAQLLDEEGHVIATNDNPSASRNPVNRLTPLISAFRGATDMMTALGKEDAMGNKPYQSDPQLGESYTNAANILQIIAPLLKSELQGQTAGMNTNSVSTTAKKAPPKVGEVVKGYSFKGGDPAVRTNWEKVGAK